MVTNARQYPGSLYRRYQCACCTPPRQIYYRAEGRYADSVHHEHDHSTATAPVSAAELRRMLRG